MISNCPDCDSVLRDPDRCRCGWARKTETVNIVSCSCCSQPATEKHKIDGVWVNFCRFHADQRKSDEAREYCAAKGLHSTDQIKRWLKDQKLMRGIPIREPGQDDEWRESAA